MSETLSPNEAYAQARQCVRRGEHTQAIRLLKALVEHEFTEPAVLETLGVAYSMGGEVEEAIRWLELCLRKNSKRLRTHVNLGTLYNRVGQYGQAVECLNEATKLDWKCAEAWYNLGISYLGLKDLGQARNMFQEALRLKPDMTDAAYRLGLVFLEIGNYQLAASWFRRVLGTHPDHVRAQRGLKRSEAAIEEASNPAGLLDRIRSDPESGVLLTAKQPVRTLSRLDLETLRGCAVDIDRRTEPLLQWFNEQADSLIVQLRKQVTQGVRRSEPVRSMRRSVETQLKSQRDSTRRLTDSLDRLIEFENQLAAR